MTPLARWPWSTRFAAMHLAQLNIARLVDDPDSEAVAEFVQALPAINLRGETSPGIVWILKDDTGGAMGFRMPGYENDPRMLINLIYGGRTVERLSI